MFAYSKTILAVALFSCARAGYLGGGGFEGGHIESYGGGYGENHVEYSGGEDYKHYPKYQFTYAVHDPHTGDEKQQYEERDGDVVKGSYSLKEADGTTRVVNYKADKHNGFEAVVSKIGEAQHDGGSYGGHGYGH